MTMRFGAGLDGCPGGDEYELPLKPNSAVIMAASERTKLMKIRGLKNAPSEADFFIALIPFLAADMKPPVSLYHHLCAGVTLVFAKISTRASKCEQPLRVPKTQSTFRQHAQ